MPLGTDHVILGEVPNFVPQLWSDEVVASYKANLTLANLVRRLNHKGKKGSSIRIPTPTRGNSSVKNAETQVNLIQHGTDAGITININRHREYSRLIEDIVDVQALGSLRRFYTDDAGYALARRIDRDLMLEAARGGLGGGTIVEDAGGFAIDNTSTFTNARIGDDSAGWLVATGGNAVDLSDLGIRRFNQRLDDVDAPMAGRYLVIPPNVKADMLGIAKFTEQNRVGESAQGNSIRNGFVGDVYGVEVYVTSQLPTVEDGGGAFDQRLCLFFQRDALVLVEQLGVRVQEQYKQEWLASLMTADVLYGVQTLRPTSVIPIVVPAGFTDG